MSFKNFSPTTDLNNLNSTLEKYGVAVVTNVFTDEECEFVKQSVFDYVAKTHDVHEPDDFRNLCPSINGIMPHYGLSLLKQVLDMKTDDRVVEVFKRLWDNEEVTMSLDSINIIPPPEKLIQKKYGKSKPWFHADQASSKKEKCCVQAFINLEHTEDGDGCLSVLLGSHKHFSEFIEQFDVDTRGHDWCPVNNEDEYDWYMKKNCEWNKILAPKGSIVCWDSRTIHMGSAPMETRVNHDRWRFAIYVCYTPARLQTEADSEKKKMAYIDNRTTSHWPYNVKVGPKIPNDTKVNKLENLTHQHRKCIGLKIETPVSLMTKVKELFKLA